MMRVETTIKGNAAFWTTMIADKTMKWCNFQEAHNQMILQIENHQQSKNEDTSKKA